MEHPVQRKKKTEAGTTSDIVNTGPSSAAKAGVDSVTVRMSTREAVARALHHVPMVPARG